MKIKIEGFKKVKQKDFYESKKTCLIVNAYEGKGQGKNLQTSYYEIN